MRGATLNGTYVTICDWRGQVVWQSAKKALSKPGELAWQHLAKESAEEVKGVFARVVSLGEEAALELRNKRGAHFRTWLWPLHSPEQAACLLSIEIPSELHSLTAREREILGLLAKGHTTREIAGHLDVSASTIHTHFRRVRRKLGLPSVEALTGYAARYCHPNDAPVAFS